MKQLEIMDQIESIYIFVGKLKLVELFHKIEHFKLPL